LFSNEQEKSLIDDLFRDRGPKRPSKNNLDTVPKPPAGMAGRPDLDVMNVKLGLGQVKFAAPEQPSPTRIQ
jgi:hypothetical protein